MPEWYQIAGLAIKELAPVAMNFYKGSQARISLEKAAVIQNESYSRMQQTLEQDSYHRRLAPQQTVCEGCRVESAGKRQLYSRIWDHLHALPRTMEQAPSMEEQASMAQYISSLVSNLPCSECAVHARDYIMSNPVDASTPQALGRWVCRYHNSVRESKGQPITHDCSAI